MEVIFLDRIIFEKYIKDNNTNIKSLVLTLQDGNKINISSADKIKFLNKILVLEYADNVTCIDFDFVSMVSINKKDNKIKSKKRV